MRTLVSHSTAGFRRAVAPGCRHGARRETKIDVAEILLPSLDAHLDSLADMAFGAVDLQHCSGLRRNSANVSDCVLR